MRQLTLLFISLCLTLSVGIGFAQEENDSKILNTANQLMQNSEYQKAVNLYTFYIRYHPENVEALSERAVAHASLDDFASAFTDINRAFNSAGFSALEQAVIHDNRGQIYFLEGNHDLALDDFSRAIELNPDFADHWLNRAILYQVRQEWGNAIADYQHYTTLEPNDSEAFLNIARIYIVLEDLDGTIDALNSAINIAPNDPELYIFRGSINLLNQDYGSAAQDYNAWLGLINSEEIEQDTITEDTTQLTLGMNYGIIHRIPFEANSGDRLGVVANSARVDSLIILLDPDGNPITADDDGGQGLNALLLDYTLPEAGVYTLIVGHARGGWLGDIDLTVQIIAAEDI